MHWLWDKYCKLGSVWKTFYLILVLLSRCRLLLLVSCKSQTESQLLTNQWKQKTLVCLVTRALVLIVFVFWICTKAMTATSDRQTFMFSFNMKPCHTLWINLYFSNHTHESKDYEKQEMGLPWGRGNPAEEGYFGGSQRWYFECWKSRLYESLEQGRPLPEIFKKNFQKSCEACYTRLHNSMCKQQS